MAWIANTQWYLYGKKYMTQTGYVAAKKLYKNYLLDEVKLNNRVFMVTGSNQGIGYEIAKFLASKSATVYMVCRNSERGRTAQGKIIEATGNDQVHLLLADCAVRTGTNERYQDLTVLNHPYV